jgi:hypothetical protein
MREDFVITAELSQSFHQMLHHWRLETAMQRELDKEANIVGLVKNNKDASDTSLAGGGVVYLVTFGGNGVFLRNNWAAKYPERS